jgi:hypothetical protein
MYSHYLNNEGLLKKNVPEFLIFNRGGAAVLYGSGPGFDGSWSGSDPYFQHVGNIFMFSITLSQ